MTSKSAKIVGLEYFRVPPRWLFVKITDSNGDYGWGEASLEGHSEAVEGCLDAYQEQIMGMDPKYVLQSEWVFGRVCPRLV